MALKRRAGALYLEDVSLERLAKRHGTPVFAYSETAILGRFESYRKAFRGLDPLICYAMKANPNGGVLRILARAGAGAEVVSGGELWRALRAGFKPSKIAFSGVGKTDEELVYALKSKILHVTVESAEEALRLGALARARKTRAPIAVRVNPDIAAKTHHHITTGTKENKFGVPVETALAIGEIAAPGSGLRLSGLHFHLGSQITRSGPYVKGLKTLFRLKEGLKRRGVDVDVLDIGGGWAVPDDGSNAPIRELAEAVKPLMRGGRTRLMVEPGRFLVADAGVLVMKVLYRKSIGRKTFVIVDAAMTDFIRPSLYGARHEVLPVAGAKGPKRRFDVVGPVCESTDFLAQNVEGPLPEPGDYLALVRAGAYGFSMASQYNSRRKPAEVLVKGSRARLARRRETYRDLVRGES